MDLVLQRSGSAKVKAFPSLDVVPLMVTMVEHVEMSRDYVVLFSFRLTKAAGSTRAFSGGELSGAELLGGG